MDTCKSKAFWRWTSICKVKLFWNVKFMFIWNRVGVCFIVNWWWENELFWENSTSRSLYFKTKNLWIISGQTKRQIFKTILASLVGNPIFCGIKFKCIFKRIRALWWSSVSLNFFPKSTFIKEWSKNTMKWLVAWIIVYLTRFGKFKSIMECVVSIPFVSFSCSFLVIIYNCFLHFHSLENLPLIFICKNPGHSENMTVFVYRNDKNMSC